MMWFFYMIQSLFLREMHFFFNIGHYTSIEKFYNEEKMKEYVYETIKHLQICLHTWIASFYAPYNMHLLISNNDIHSYIINHYQMEYGIYIYELFDIILKKDLMYFYHHLLTLLLMYGSQAYHFVNYGFYIMTLMSYTNIPFIAAKIVRNTKDTKMNIYTDSLFLVSFGYLRVYSFTKSIYENYHLNLLHNFPFFMYILLFSLWSLQVVWFTKLGQIYIKEHILSQYRKRIHHE